MTRDELKTIVLDFTEAFNRDDFAGVMGHFADDAIYDEFNGKRHEGADAIREAFEPMFAGAFGKIRFIEDDLFLDADEGKAMISWTCSVETPERASSWCGLDLLHVRDGKITRKLTYAKTEMPLFRPAAAQAA